MSPHPEPVRAAVMVQTWSHLTFLHWRYAPSVLRPFVPAELSVDVFDGSAWIGVTPFLLKGLRIPHLPPAPWISQFPETNCRTYVTGPDGESAIWFFSLDCARLLAVLGARLGYGLPYVWSKMEVDIHKDRLDYRSRRRWPHRDAHTDISIEAGSRIEPGELELFLTARFRLYSKILGRLVYADVEHPPWPLFEAKVVHWEQSVVAAVGLPAVRGEPSVLYSPGVVTRVGPPRHFRSTEATVRSTKHILEREFTRK